MAELVQLAARLLTHLPPQRVLERFAVVDATTRQEPRPGVRAGELAHQEHTPLGVGARDDRREASWSSDEPKASAGRAAAWARAAGSHRARVSRREAGSAAGASG